MDALRIGTLGAARITPPALVRPARQVDGVEVVAVAARDRARASEFAAKHGIPQVHDSYDALIADPDDRRDLQPAAERAPRGVDREGAPRPGSTCSARSRSPRTPPRPSGSPRSRTQTGLVVMEAFHYRYHPVAEQLRDDRAVG